MEKETIAFTSTIPVEIVIASGKRPVDLNNIFVSSLEKEELLNEAENLGLPRNLCSWIKGIFVTALRAGVKKVIGVLEGDCSNTHALLDLWKEKGIEVIPFSYPADRDRELLSYQISKLSKIFGVTEKEVKKVHQSLNSLRQLADKIDLLTWKENLVSGWENHYYLISTSDFLSSPELYEEEARKLLAKAVKRKPFPQKIRLAYIGVPPIFPEIYDYLEKLGARVVFNEVQRQFSMPDCRQSLVEQYLAYTFPYDIFARLEDIKREIKKRKVHGVINYVQSFCYRSLYESLIKKSIDLPVLTIEGDLPGEIDFRTQLRLKSFVEMLKEMV